MYSCEVQVVLATGTSIVRENLTFVVDGMCQNSVLVRGDNHAANGILAPAAPVFNCASLH